MIYWILFLNYSACSILIYMGFYVYGTILKYLGTKGFFLKHVVSYFVYIIFAIYIVIPLLLPFDFIDDLHIKVRDGIIFNIINLTGYALCLAPGIFLFKAKFLKDLKKLGYFVR